MSTVKRLFLLAILMAASGSASCASRTTVHPTTAGARSDQWQGDSPGLHVWLTLTQPGDSITGAGNYEVRDATQIGCGGETIPAKGTVSLTGVLAADTLAGRFRFSGDWSPPYRALLVGDSLKGTLMSVDRNGCPLVLTRQH